MHEFRDDIIIRYTLGKLIDKYKKMLSQEEREKRNQVNSNIRSIINQRKLSQVASNSKPNAEIFKAIYGPSHTLPPNLNDSLTPSDKELKHVHDYLFTKETLSVIKNNRQESFSSKFNRERIIGPPPKPPGYKFKLLNVNLKGSSDEDDDDLMHKNTGK